MQKWGIYKLMPYLKVAEATSLFVPIFWLYQSISPTFCAIINSESEMQQFLLRRIWTWHSQRGDALWLYCQCRWYSNEVQFQCVNMWDFICSDEWSWVEWILSRRSGQRWITFFWYPLFSLAKSYNHLCSQMDANYCFNGDSIGNSSGWRTLQFPSCNYPSRNFIFRLAA